MCVCVFDDVSSRVVRKNLKGGKKKKKKCRMKKNLVVIRKIYKVDRRRVEHSFVFFFFCLSVTFSF